MFEVVIPGEQLQAEAISTAYRGDAVFVKRLNTNGNLGVSIPRTSVEAANAYMLVDFTPASGIEYSDSATGADRITATPYPVVCHYGGTYRTTRCDLTGSTYKYRTGLASPEATDYGGYDNAVNVANNFNPFPMLWVDCSANHGQLTDTTDSTKFNRNDFSGVGTQSRANANWWLISFDNASADDGSDSVMQTAWAEVKSIPHRIGKGYHNVFDTTSYPRGDV